MPCRKESFLLLEQSVTVGSGEVDSLVARIGEALQLNAQRAPTSCSMAYGALKPVSRAGPSCLCVRGRSTPYPVCTPRGAARHAQHLHHHHQSPRQQQQGGGGNKRLCGRGWGRCNCRKHAGTEEEEEDPHELLQELLLSGNLIKEAVRRLHMTGESPDPPGSRKVSESTETAVQ